MVKKFDLLVFDWDGTLLDSAEAIVTSLKSACRDLDLPEPSTGAARHVIGLGLGDALRLAVPDLADDQYPRMIERYRYHYLSRDHDLRLFDGVSELIADLKASGYLLAVATGKSRSGLNRSLLHCGLARFFSATRCGDECFSKPHPQMLEELMEEFAISPERTLMIGDTTHDLQMAINAGVAGLAVAYGAHAAQELDAMNPLARLDNVGDLSDWLRTRA